MSKALQSKKGKKRSSAHSGMAPAAGAGSRPLPPLFHVENTHVLASRRHCVRAAKELDSKSNGLCPQGLESPRCRINLPGL